MVLSREFVLIGIYVIVMLLLKRASTVGCDDDALLLIWLRGVEAVGKMDEEEVVETKSS
jgi:uncharacterized membrane protein (Fun14 family)